MKKYHKCVVRITKEIGTVSITCNALYESLSDTRKEMFSELTQILKENNYWINDILDNNVNADIILFPGIKIDEELIKNTSFNRKTKEGVRFCQRMYDEYKIPYGISFPKTTYDARIKDCKSSIMPFLNVSYMCFHHQHTDKYVHFAPINILKTIIATGEMSSITSSEDNTLGKGIYTYPLKSGMFFQPNGLINYGYIIFETDAMHHHIVQTDDSTYGIGEADFLLDKIKVKVEPYIYSLEEIKEISKKAFDWDYAQENYYGINKYDANKNCAYDEIQKVIEKYN